MKAPYLMIQKPYDIAASCQLLQPVRLIPEAAYHVCVNGPWLLYQVDCLKSDQTPCLRFDCLQVHDLMFVPCVRAFQGIDCNLFDIEEAE